MSLMSTADLALDERLQLIAFLIKLSTDCGESLEVARAQAKDEIDRLVAKGDVLTLLRLKARVAVSQRVQDPQSAGSTSTNAQRQDNKR